MRVSGRLLTLFLSLSIESESPQRNPDSILEASEPSTFTHDLSHTGRPGESGSPPTADLSLPSKPLESAGAVSTAVDPRTGSSAASGNFDSRYRVQPIESAESKSSRKFDARSGFNISSNDPKGDAKGSGLDSMQPVDEKDGVLSVENKPDASPPPPAANSEDNSESADDCSHCYIIYEYVDVYYPPQATSNTDCLTDLAPTPLPTFPPGLETEPGSAYVVIPALSAGNACTQIAKYTSQTFTFGPGELSTIEGPANITKEFNFADLPCPPPDIASAAIWFYNPEYNPQQTYAPVVAPFPQIYDLDPALSSCTVALNQGFDPGRAIPEVSAPTLPKDGLDHLGPTRRDRSPLIPRDRPMNVHFVPILPQETPSSKKE
ncbi:MAG: hypothetical protein Q9222_006607 [Ikaeria aurantiellina]